MSVGGLEWTAHPSHMFRDEWEGTGEFLGSGRYKSPRKWVPIAESLATSNNGRLPHRNWLIKNGYSGLDFATHKAPELFAHIPKDKKTTALDETVSVAESLARNNGGSIPPYVWLRDNGFRNVCRALSKYPDSFSHLQRQSYKKGPASSVKEIRTHYNTPKPPTADRPSASPDAATHRK
jgi:hypothetical protein